MQRTTAIVPVLLIALCAMTSPALAKGKFTNFDVLLTDGNVRELQLNGTFHGGILVSFREVGAGSNEPTNYLVTADATATYVCINDGGNQPQAANKEGVAGPIQASATFTADKGGQVIGAIPVAPLGPGSFLCPPGQNIVLAEVTYRNVVIRDLTNGASASLPGPYSMNLLEH